MVFVHEYLIPIYRLNFYFRMTQAILFLGCFFSKLIIALKPRFT